MLYPTWGGSIQASRFALNSSKTPLIWLKPRKEHANNSDPSKVKKGLPKCSIWLLSSRMYLMLELLSWECIVEENLRCLSKCAGDKEKGQDHNGFKYHPALKYGRIVRVSPVAFACLRKMQFTVSEGYLPHLGTWIFVESASQCRWVSRDKNIRWILCRCASIWVRSQQPEILWKLRCCFWHKNKKSCVGTGADWEERGAWVRR